MNLPPGFQLEDSEEKASGLPPGFVLEEEPKKRKSTIKEDISKSFGDVLNTVDIGVSLPWSLGARLYGGREKQDQTFEALNKRVEERKKSWGLPADAEQNFAGKALGVLGTLPLQVAALPVAAAETGKTFIDEGESVGRAQAAMGLDAALNMLGIVLPGAAGATRAARVGSGALINAAQDTASRMGIGAIAEKQGTKDIFAPSLETAALAGIPGAAVGAISKGRKQASVLETPEARMKAAAEARKAQTKAEEAGIAAKPEALPEVFTASPEGVVYPKDANADFYREKAMEKMAQALDEQVTPPVKPIPDEAQQGLPFMSSVEDIAAQRAARDETGQMDMFVEADKRPDPFQEQLVKAAIDEPNMRLAEQEQQAVRQQQIEQAFREREAEQQAQRDIEAQLAKEEQLIPLQEQLAPERVSKGQQRKANQQRVGGMRRGQTGALDFEAIAETFPWFKNSKVTIPLYRGVKTDYTGPERPMAGIKGHGVYLTGDPDLAGAYAGSGNIRQAYVNLKNPLIVERWSDVFDPVAKMSPEKRQQWTEQQKKKGYDGVIEQNSDGSFENVVVFDPENVKSAFSTGMGRSQRGAVDFGGSMQAKNKFVEDLLGKTIKATPPLGDDVVAAALQEGKDGRGWSYTESGATLAAMKRGSAAVLGASRITQDAQNRADLAKRQYVLPAESSLRRLSKENVTKLMDVFLKETEMKQKFSMQELVDFGYDVKTVAAYNDLRAMHTAALSRMNEMRVLKGEKPVTELEYYSSHRWQGNFRQDFRDADDRHVWSLAGKTKWDLERQRKALLKEFPDLKADKQRILRQGKDVASPAELYKHMLDILGEDDPAVARIKQWYEKAGVEDPTAAMLAQEKHFKRQTGVRGFIGDRLVNEPAGMFNRSEGKFNKTKEAFDFFQEQITVAKNGFAWAEMQRAGQEIKKIVSDKGLQDQQPNNVKYIKDYWKQNLGVSEAKWVAAAEDAMHDYGISPREVRKTVGDIKSAWIGQKLLASAGFVASNMIQATAVLPHMADIMVKDGGNPLSGLMSGMMGAMAVAPTHLMTTHFPDKPSAAKAKKLAMMTMPEWHAKAMKYAEDNGVISRSTYDESPIEASFSKTKQVAEAVGKATIGAPETIVRSFAFMAFAEQLRSSGKYANDTDIFRLAEERTSAAMVDMRGGERPILFNKLGMAGDLAGALQTFPVNFYNQWNWAVRESLKGNVLPAAVMALTQYSVAGFMGLPGFQDLDKLMEMTKTWAAKNDPKLWDQIKDLNPKRLVMDNLGESSLYGKLSTESGYAMTSRVASPSLYEMATSGGNVVGDIGKQIGNAAKLAYSPSQEQLAKTVIESAPVGMQGALEVGPLRDIVSKDTPQGRLYEKRGTDKGDYYRTPKEEEKRAGLNPVGEWGVPLGGVRAQSEALSKDEFWNMEKRKSEAKDAARSSLDAFTSAAVKQDAEAAASYLRLYVDITGKAPTEKQITNKVLEMYTSKVERGIMSAKDNLAAITAIKRMQDIVNHSETP